MAGPLSRPSMNTVSVMVPSNALIREARDWKINLIERDNPHWNDLYMTLVF